jgi:hypothetical protein
MIAVRIETASGIKWVTRFNGTHKDALEYFMGQTFCTSYTGEVEKFGMVTKVTLIQGDGLTPVPGQVWITKAGHFAIIVNTEDGPRMLWFDEIDRTLEVSQILDRLDILTENSPMSVLRTWSTPYLPNPKDSRIFCEWNTGGYISSLTPNFQSVFVDHVNKFGPPDLVEYREDIPGASDAPTQPDREEPQA